MDWKELQEKYQRLQSDGKTADEAAEMLKDEIGVFAKECFNQPEKLTDAMPDLVKAVGNNPVLADILYFLLFRPRGGWGW